MSGVVFLVLLLSSWQYVCAQRKCTKTDVCKPVKPEICDNSKCLEVDRSELDKIFNKNATIHDWNILQPPFTNGCPFKFKYEEPTPTDVANKVVRGAFVTYTGDSCDHEVSVPRVFTSDIDISGGKLRLLTGDVSGITFQSCFLYIELGVGFVYRICAVDRTDEPCAAIYSIEVGSEESEDDNIHKFLNKLAVPILETVADCVA